MSHEPNFENLDNPMSNAELMQHIGWLRDRVELLERQIDSLLPPTP